MDGGLIAGLIGVLAGAVGGSGALHLYNRLKANTARGVAEGILADARRDADALVKDADLRAKEEALRRRESVEREAEDARKVVREAERRVEKREDLLDQKLDLINKKEREVESVQKFLASRQEEINKKDADVKSVLNEQRDVLQRVSNLSRDEARDLLLRRLDEELSHEVGGLILKHDQHLKETCQAKAREILITTIQRYAAGHTAETTVSDRRHPERRHEGPDHRPRGPEHPRLREGDRRRRDRRRHARESSSSRPSTTSAARRRSSPSKS